MYKAHTVLVTPSSWLTTVAFFFFNPVSIEIHLFIWFMWKKNMIQNYTMGLMSAFIKHLCFMLSCVCNTLTSYLSQVSSVYHFDLVASIFHLHQGACDSPSRLKIWLFVALEINELIRVQFHFSWLNDMFKDKRLEWV